MSSIRMEVDGIPSSHVSGDIHIQQFLRLKEDCPFDDETCYHSGECEMSFSEQGPEWISDETLRMFHTSLNEWEPLRV